ncbi:membrane protein [Tsukamurella sp. 1534]|uniref:DoxX family protein n=1 Tax=Tsukamurella sp. 1534 TaxID=1151061 RepID=UPI0006ACCFBD|nr:membrane protein [Tsukamurella sp. 1534]
MVSTTDGPRRSDKAARGMALSLAGMGVAHFVAPKPFDSIVPPNLPLGLTPRRATQLSGVAELTTAGLLAVPRTRRLGGVAAVALFAAVFPANVYMAQQWSDKPLPLRLGAYARLPLQLPMITTAVKIARDK